MGTTPRPPKPAGGSANYVDEVAAGFPDIIDADVDLDFNTLYNLVNGNIDDANINVLGTGVKIQYRKLDLAGKILGSDLAPGTTLPSGTVDTTSLKDGAVTTAKIGIGQTTFALAQLSDAPGISIGTAEQLLGELVWTPASRGGYHLAVGRLSGQMDGNANENVTVTINLKSDGNPGDVTGNLLDQTIQNVSFTVSPGFSWSVPWSVTLIAVHVLSTTSRMKLTGQTTTPQAVGFGCTIHTRALRVWELA